MNLNVGRRQITGAAKGAVLGLVASLFWFVGASLVPGLASNETMLEWWQRFENSNKTVMWWAAGAAATIGVGLGWFGAVLRDQRKPLLLFATVATASLVPPFLLAVASFNAGGTGWPELFQSFVGGFSLSILFVPLCLPVLVPAALALEWWTRPEPPSGRTSG